MGKKDERVDAYIEQAADFAKPILTHLRSVVHKACPDIEETIKWKFPHFDYKGPVCAMAAFKKHCAFDFWKGAIMKDEHKLMTIIGKTGMGQFGKLATVEDLPSEEILTAYLKEAIDLNERGIKLPKPKKEKAKLEIPDYFMEAVKGSSKALETFNGFSYTNQKEYVEWVTSAKREATRDKRLATAVEWMAEGKVKNWKYL